MGYSDLDTVLEKYECELLSEKEPEDPDKFVAQRFKDIQLWEQIKQASSAERQLADGEELYRPGAKVDGFYVVTSGVMAMETRSAKDTSATLIPQRSTEYDQISGGRDARIWTGSAIYSAPCAVGLSPY